MGLHCPVCHEIGFKCVKDFCWHLRAHRPPTPVKCGIPSCSITFTLFHNLKRHLTDFHRHELFDVVETYEDDLGPSTSNASFCQQAINPQLAADPHMPDPPPDPTPLTSNDIFVQFICDLGKSPAVTNATIDGVISGVENLLNNIGTVVKADITASVTNNGGIMPNSGELESLIGGVFSRATNPVNTIRTAKQRETFLTEHGFYIKPQEFVVGKPNYHYRRNNLETHGVNSFKYDKVYTVSIKDTLLKVLANESIQEKLLWPHNRHSETLEHCFDGNRMKSLYQRIKKPFLAIELYYDEMEPGNPLGSKAAINKIGNFYMCLRNLPNWYNSCGANIHLVTIGYSGDFKQHGYGAIMEHFWTELAELEEGIEIELTHGTLTGTHILPVVLSAIVGDNLAVHQVQGFKEGFTAHRFCHNCLITLAGFRQYPLRQSSARVPAQHDQIAKSLNPDTSKEYGINYHCSLNDLKYFHVTQNPAADIMHDFLEGIIPMELSHILRQLIYVSQFFTLDFLNNKIKTFPYGRHAKPKIPTQLSAPKLRKSEPLKQYAAQTATLLLMLPLMIGHLVPANNRFYLQLLDLCSIWAMLQSPVIDSNFMSSFSQAWKSHVISFKALFPSVILKPKWHYVFHYFKIMEDYGPLYHQMCMRYETKNNFFCKAARTMKCFKNVPLTLASRCQRAAAHHLFTNAFDRDLCEVGPSRFLPFYSLSQTLNSCFPGGKDLLYSSYVVYRGVHYHRQDFLVISVESDFTPIFGRIEAVVQHDEVWYFFVEKFTLLQFCTYFKRYKISSTKEFQAMEVAALKHHIVHDAYSMNGSMFIPQKYYVFPDRV